MKKRQVISISLIAIITIISLFESCKKSSNTSSSSSANIIVSPTVVAATGTTTNICQPSYTGTGSYNVNTSSLVGTSFILTCPNVNVADCFVTMVSQTNTTSSVMLEFKKGIPLGGTYLIRNVNDFSTSTSLNEVIVTYSEANNYYCGSVNKVVTVVKTGNSLSFSIPTIDVYKENPAGNSGVSLQLSATFTVN